MASKSRINVVSSQSDEFSGYITANNVTYFVQTEDLGTRTCQIVSRVYLQGEVVFSRKSDYSHILKLTDLDFKRKTLAESQHKNTIALFLKAKSGNEKSGNDKLQWDYFEEIKQLLKSGRGKDALKILRSALEKFPADPFLLSYYGCLVAVVENNPGEGAQICRDSINKLDKSMPLGREFYYPVFYLNLGRAYLKGNKKADAIRAFWEGLKNDPENRDLLSELKRLGNRKRQLVPFVRRSNPLNKYLGMLLHKVSS